MLDISHKKFYAYLPLLRFYAKYTLPCCGFFLLLALLGQMGSGRFPAYGDLAFASGIPIVAFAIITVLILADDYYCPLCISKTGLKGCNCFGYYSSINWDRIVSVTEVKKFGSTCLYIENNTFKASFIVPLWLDDLDDFCITVERYAGKNNPLAIALMNATHYKS